MKITTGVSRKDTHWKVEDLSWQDLCKRLSKTTTTPETLLEYRALDKDLQSDIKDVGGFVGGELAGGNRSKANVKNRTLITLDADYADVNLLDNLDAVFDNAMCVYSTHKHTPKAPRLRLVIPLDRPVSPEEYEPIARKIASDAGIDQFDITTYETNRLMYWPSTSRDGEFIFKEYKGDFLSADDTLARYNDWRDASEWPIGESESTVRNKNAVAQGNPTEKPGLIGLFCRAYDIHSAIETFLPDVYEPCMGGTRYTYTKGSTTAGAVVYGDGMFLYSHHSTDPACGKLCNAFDLVRIHKYGHLDAKTPVDTQVNKTPSYRAMCDFAKEDAEVKRLSIASVKEQIEEAFGVPTETPEADDSWAQKLKLNKTGAVEATTNNLVIILSEDPHFKNKLAVNSFTGRPCITDDMPWRVCDDNINGSPWSDDDASALRHYVETVYGVSNVGKLDDAVRVVMMKNSFHPVRRYLESLEWDGVMRAEDIFIHYMGAVDNEYTRTVTRKWLTAAVARVMRPGIKFDNLVVLVGPQGVGKSYLGSRLGKYWFSDTFTTVQGKDAYDQLKGNWIVEIGELSAMKKAEVEAVKMFISKQEDNYRAAYGRFAQVNKRQCVFYGTTNDDTFLRDSTGNRRFWPISVRGEAYADESVFSMADEEVDQIWAEAKTWYDKGESLYLNTEARALAVIEQEKYMQSNPKQGQIEEYLEMKIPENWETFNKTERRNYIQGFTVLPPGTVTVKRNVVSMIEMAYELFGESELKPWDAKEYHNILTRIPGWHKTGERPMTIFGRQYVYKRDEEDGQE